MAQVMACCLHISSGNGLLPDSTKPLPEPVLVFYLLGPMAFIQGQFGDTSATNHENQPK